MTSFSILTNENRGVSPLAIDAAFADCEISADDNRKPRYVRRVVASEYLLTNYGFGAKKWLDKLATTGGGPKFRKAGKTVLYTKADLDEWAMSRIGRAQSSTSDVEGA